MDGLSASQQVDRFGQTVEAAVLVIVILYVFAVVLLVAAYWKMFRKAGYSGWLALLLPVPLVNFFLILWFGFSDWPVLRQMRSLRATPAAAHAAPVPAAAPASTTPAPEAAVPAAAPEVAPAAVPDASPAVATEVAPAAVIEATPAPAAVEPPVDASAADAELDAVLADVHRAEQLSAEDAPAAPPVVEVRPESDVLTPESVEPEGHAAPAEEAHSIPEQDASSPQPQAQGSAPQQLPLEPPTEPE